jgi:hypothetical protein
MKLTYMTALALVCFCGACKKNDSSDIQPGDTGSIELEFDNVVGTDDLTLNDKTYTNGSGETYTVSSLRYFISNVKLKADNGTEYVVPAEDSYYLINEQDESTHVIELENVPAANYTSFTFSVGVDNAKATSPLSERTGVLDPAGEAAGMYRSENDGYIFLKLEGTSPVSGEDNNVISYQIGGYGGTTGNNYKAVTVNAPSGISAKVRKNKTTSPEVHLFADVAKIFDGTTHISLATNPIVDFSAASAAVGNNYATMFNVDHIHND